MTAMCKLRKNKRLFQTPDTISEQTHRDRNRTYDCKGLIPNP